MLWGEAGVLKARRRVALTFGEPGSSCFKPVTPDEVKLYRVKECLD